jgi:hypothetical protein
MTILCVGRPCRCQRRDSSTAAARVRREAIGEVFNVGNPEDLSRFGNAGEKTDGKLVGDQIHPYAEAYAPGFEDMQRRVPNFDKITRLTGFKPKLKLVNVVRRLIESKREGMELLAGLPVTAAVPLQSRHAVLAE